ncbi:MAG TPA: hypothetical protein VHQ46_00630 [Desulfobacteria bacterium]|nr:hypothetical protein [Desulfobacteria bacterium]
MNCTQLLASCLSPLGLPDRESAYLIKVLCIALQQRSKELTAEIEHAEQQVANYVRKYGVSYQKYRAAHIAEGSQSLDDLVTWGFWERLKDNRMQLLAKYRSLIETSLNN